MKERFLAVDVADYEIQCLEVEKDGDRLRIVKSTTAKCASKIPTVNELKALLGSPTKGKRTGRLEVHLSLPSRLMTSRVINLPPTGEKETRAAVEFELREVLNAQHRELYWDCARVSLNGEPTEKGPVFAFAAVSERLKPYLDPFKEIGVRVRRLIPSDIASFHLARVALRSGKDSPFIVLSMKPSETSVILGIRTHVLTSRVVPHDPQGEPGAILSEIGRTVDFFQRRFPGVTPDEIVVLGESGLVSNVVKGKDNLSGIPLRVVGSQHLDALSERFEWIEKPKGEVGTFFSSLGITATPRETNLLPRDRERRSIVEFRSISSGCRRLLPAIIAVLILLASWIGGNNYLAGKRQDCIDNADKIQDEITKLNTELSLVRRIAKTKIPWSAAARLIGECARNNVEVIDIGVDEENQVRFRGKREGSVNDIYQFIAKLEENGFISNAKYGGFQTVEKKIEFKFTAILGIPKENKDGKRPDSMQQPVAPPPQAPVETTGPARPDGRSDKPSPPPSGEPAKQQEIAAPPAPVSENKSASNELPESIKTFLSRLPPELRSYFEERFKSMSPAVLKRFADKIQEEMTSENLDELSTMLSNAPPEMIEEMKSSFDREIQNITNEVGGQ